MSADSEPGLSSEAIFPWPQLAIPPGRRHARRRGDRHAERGTASPRFLINPLRTTFILRHPDAPPAIPEQNVRYPEGKQRRLRGPLH